MAHDLSGCRRAADSDRDLGGVRAGATDWRYLATLEEAVARATGAEHERGVRVLREMVAEIPWRGELRPGWGNSRAAQLRARMAE